MALNWNTFLDDSLTLPDEQWADFSQAAAASAPLSAMPKPTSAQRKPGPGPDDLNGFDPYMNGPSFVDDNLFNPNDYFLSDYEVLQPFGDTLAGNETTSESSPEPTSGISLTGPFTQTETPLSHTPASTATGLDQSPQMSQMQHQQQQQLRQHQQHQQHQQQQQRPSAQRAMSYPNPQYESMFPPPLEPSYAEDMTYLNARAGTLHTSKPAEKVEREQEQHKRNKNNPDILSACWTSPLCPNHDQDGPPPNPSSCGGGCAPFLFAEEPTGLPSLLPPEPQEVIAEEGVVEIQPRPKKRSESMSSSEPTGRQFRDSKATTTTYSEQPAQLKSETTDNSPQQPPEAPPAEEGKPKSRRRLPHNQVERKYRESLNTQLESLRRVVPALQQNPRVCDGADIEDLPAPSKPSKAVILASATAYIKQVEKENKTMQEENAMLRARIKALQALVKCDDCSLMQYVMDLKINNHQLQPPKCAPPV